jgi:general secretion pathway protein A
MYKAFFNLRDNPFSLNPDPHFLFPSERHRDAFRYLLYGIKTREGFIEVIGDVGTGKTLLCRSLLALLGDDVKSALILNPPYSDIEFFEYLMRDLGIQRRVDSRSSVLESINEFLLNEYHEGRNVIIIIDESQHLSIELLEQIRLLSNLETERKKLLQIILVGQPELEDKLRSPQMRQLDQRIALRYYLEPLKKKELKEYIYHRLRVAGSTGGITFTKGALNKIYKFSKGTPRLINVVCDKALLTAYFFKKRHITAKHITIALRSTQRRWSKFPRLKNIGFSISHAMYSFAILTILLMLALNWKSYGDMLAWTRKTGPVLSLIKTGVLHQLHVPSTDKQAYLNEENFSNEELKQIEKLQQAEEPQKIDVLPEETPVAVVSEPEPKAVTPAPTIIQETELEKPAVLPAASAEYDVLSFANLLAVWGLEKSKDKDGWERGIDGKLNYEEIAQRYDLNVYVLTTDLQELSVINLPCILEQVTDNQSGQKLPLVLTGLSDDWALVIHPNEGEVSYTKDDLASRWAGEAVLLWRNIDQLGDEPISPWRGEEGIEKVEMRLRQLGYFKDYPSTDMVLRKKQRARALMNFQQDHNLTVDGILGMRSRLVLYNIVDQPVTPTLKRELF